MSRPLWVDWAQAIAACFGIVFAVEMVYGLYTGSGALEALNGALGGALVALQLSIPLSLFGVWLARNMGWRKASAAGAVLGILGYAVLLTWWTIR